jgi:hypothetical protein
MLRGKINDAFLYGLPVYNIVTLNSSRAMTGQAAHCLKGGRYYNWLWVSHRFQKLGPNSLLTITTVLRTTMCSGGGDIIFS